jgi:hypothetical protein
MAAGDSLPALPTEPKPGVYRHYKGGDYEVIEICRHSETLEPMVVYRALYGERGLWARPHAMWSEQITINGQKLPRFRPESG